MRKCELCGATTNKKRKRSTIEKHHISYKPSVVVDLCKSCHTIVTNYERNPDVYNTEESRFEVLKRYDELRETKQPEESEGTQVLSVRLAESEMYTLRERADKQGLTIGGYIKLQILKSLNHSVNTKDVRTPIDAVSPSVQREGKASVPLYNPSIHRAGDRVLVQKGKRLIETVIPKLDADGYPIYEE